MSVGSGLIGIDEAAPQRRGIFRGVTSSVVSRTKQKSWNDIMASGAAYFGPAVASEGAGASLLSTFSEVGTRQLSPRKRQVTAVQGRQMNVIQVNGDDSHDISEEDIG